MENSGESITSVLDLEPFFELTHDLLCIAGYDGYFKRINPAVCKILGYTERELMAVPIANFIYYKDKERTADTRRRLIDDVPLLNFENRYLTKDGEIVWLSWSSIPVSKDQVVYAIAKNITHNKKLEEERNQVVINITTINHDLNLLTQTTSHDLRAPVNNLLAVFSLLDISKIEDEETLEFIDVLQSASETLRDTLNEYVDALNKKETHMVETEELNLEVSLKEVMFSLRSLLDASFASIKYDFTNLPIILFNKTYLQSIFLNLISNSIKYSRSGVAPVIIITSQYLNGVEQLIYSDQGQGFDLELVGDRIFGLNQKFHDSHDSKGIGLYLVHSHIVRLGGSINVVSEPNRGATFTISFKKG